MQIQRILLSLAVIVALGGGVVASTGAFFNDTETSTGNVFTAGAIDLTVDSTQHYNNAICALNELTLDDLTDYSWHLEAGGVLTNPQYPVIGDPCDGTWLATNLGAEKFFNFNDVKPGDSGENTLSLHVTSNAAWACADVHITKNDDVDCTDPENDAEGPGVCNNSSPSADFDGDLAQGLNFFAWLDQGVLAGFQNTPQTPAADPLEGDNIYQGDLTEPHLFSNVFGPASDALNDKHYTLAAPPGLPLPAGGNTNYIGLAWCAGTMTVNTVTGAIGCNGAGMDNKAQTDQLMANIAFRVEQARNNPNFSCNPPLITPTPTPTLPT